QYPYSMRLTARLGSLALIPAAAAFGYSNLEYCNLLKHDIDRERKAKEAISRYMTERGIPGLSVAVSVDGRVRYSDGFGYADLETGAPCTANTVMRIASISKPITSTVAALLVDKGKIDLSQPIQKYIPDFPKKTFNNNPTEITTRMLLSHTGGIRHYEKKGEQKAVSDGAAPKTSEFYLNKPFADVTEALKMFSEDELVSEPGETFSYTTHGFTMVAAICEKVSGDKFENLLTDLFRRLGMRNTLLDRNAIIVPNRAKYYNRNSKGLLENTPEVDNSYKWAGGGVLSTAPDLLIFANSILYSHQSSLSSSTLPKPLISFQTISDFWKGEISIGRYELSALGWMRVNVPEGGSVGGAIDARSRGGYWYHSGGAVGASSVLYIQPSNGEAINGPRGICVAILVNIQSCSVQKLAEELAEIYREY
ncbi:lact-9, partial [Pristionchus pacificus]